MKILPPESEITLYEEGFSEADILDRKKVGTALSSLSNRIDDPLVIALNGKWGTGKSYFLKRWVGQHTIDNDNNTTTLYFDAFEHDYLSDPLPALVSALATRVSPTKESEIRKLRRTALKLMKPLSKAGLSLITFGVTNALNEAGDVVAEALSDEASANLEEFWEIEDGRREAMKEFRRLITGLLSTPDADESSTLLIVVDELDRCRPDYALELIEVLKHFFSVPRVHIVLGVNLEALENMVRVRYGNDFNAYEYLKKFINITVELPRKIQKTHTPTTAVLTYLSHLSQEMGLPEKVSTSLKDGIKIVSQKNEINIRDIERIISHLILANDKILNNPETLDSWIDLAVDLVIAKQICPRIYHKFLNATATTDELIDYFDASPEKISPNLGENSNPNYAHPVWWRYNMWRFITSDGSEDDYNSSIRRSFALKGMEDPRSLPAKANSLIIDQFQFYDE